MTLIEVVVALAVLSLVVLVLGASLRGMAQSAQRIDERVDRVDEMRVAVGFLHEVLERVADVRAEPTGHGLLLAASGEELAWVAVMPARFGAAGRYHFRLAVEPTTDGRAALVLRYAPWTGEARFPDWAVAEARVLAADVTEVALRYGGDGVDAGWLAAWPPPPPLPAALRDQPPPRVRLDVATATHAWPSVIVPLRVQSGRGGRGGFVVGGGTR